MAVNMTIDLSEATFADLVALVRAAEVAGVDKLAPVSLDNNTLTVTVTTPIVTPSSAAKPVASTPAPAAGVGDAAIRSVIDILSGRQDPPRG